MTEDLSQDHLNHLLNELTRYVADCHHDEEPAYVRGRLNNVRSTLNGCWAHLEEGIKLGIVQRLREAMELYGLVAPNLYDLVGFVNSSTSDLRWPTQFPQTVLTSAISDLVGENQTLKSCRDRRTEIKESVFLKEWHQYPPEKQLECIGDTYWTQRALREKRKSFPERPHLTRDEVKELTDLYPQLEVYRQIIAWNGDSPSFLQFLPHVPPELKPGSEDPFKPTRRSHPSSPVLTPPTPPSQFMLPEHFGPLVAHSDTSGWLGGQ